MELKGRISVGVCLLVAFVAGFLARGLTSSEGNGNRQLAAIERHESVQKKGSNRAGNKELEPIPKVVPGFENLEIKGEAARRFSWALREPTDLERYRKVAEALAMMDADDAEDAISVFQQHHFDGRRFKREIRDLMRRLGQIDGERALTDRRFEGPGKPDRSEWRYIMSGWATVEPEKAKAWLEKQEDGDFKNRMMKGLIEGMAQGDVDRAAEYMNSLPLSQQLANLDTMVWYQLHDDSYLKLGGWIDSLPDGADGDPLSEDQTEYGRRVFSRTATQLLEAGTNDARVWLEQHADSPYVTSGSIQQVAVRMGSEDNRAALDWVWNLPTDGTEVRRLAIGTAIGNWATNDLDAAGTWLGGQDRDSPLYDEAAKSYVGEVAEVNLEAARQWAETIQSPEIRDEVLRGLESSELVQ